MGLSALPIAFLGGLVSFLSPCVLPIVPGFLAYLAGTSLEDSTKNRGRVFLSSLFFVLGFSTVFSLLGVLLNTVLLSIATDVQIWLSRIGGVVIIAFGLFLMGLISIPFLERGRTVSITRQFRSRLVTSFVFGAAFAAGWTPCVGAVLGGILTLSVSAPGSAFALLLSYSLGLGIPFLIVGLFAEKAVWYINRYTNQFQYLQVAFGALLIGIGILIFTAQLSRLVNIPFLNNFLL